MKIKAVEKIVRAEHSITLIGTEAGNQWIAATGAMYPLYGFPRMDKPSVFAWMDVPEKKRQSFAFRHDPEFYEEWDFSDAAVGEIFVERGLYSVNTPTRCMEPLNVSDGVIYLDSAYMKPFGEGALLYERRSKSGRLYIAVKEGLLLKGIILPMLIERSFADDLLDIARQTMLAKNYIVSEETEE